MTIPEKTRSTLVAAGVACCSFFAPCARGADAEMPEPQRFTQEWNLKPTVPTGWIKIDEKSAAITSSRKPDVFVLMKDPTNVVLVWFRREGTYWNMIVIESMTAKSLLGYGVKVEQLGLSIQKKKIFLGVEGSEAVSIFEWDRRNEYSLAKRRNDLRGSIGRRSKKCSSCCICSNSPARREVCCRTARPFRRVHLPGMLGCRSNNKTEPTRCRCRSTQMIAPQRFNRD